MDYKFIASMIIVFAILVNLVCGLVFAMVLYESSSEREGLGFNKYWNVFMTDAMSLGKNVLIFEGERLETFLLYRKIAIGGLSTIFVCVLVTLIL